MEGRVAIAPVKAFEQNVRVCKAKSSMVCVCVGGCFLGRPAQTEESALLSKKRTSWLPSSHKSWVLFLTCQSFCGRAGALLFLSSTRGFRGGAMDTHS